MRLYLNGLDLKMIGNGQTCSVIDERLKLRKEERDDGSAR